VFARLSTKGKPAEPTLITTGTGSGKTQSFWSRCSTTAGFSAFGLLAVAALPAPAWFSLHRLASHTRSTS
jgi:hypothetical protein